MLVIFTKQQQQQNPQKSHKTTKNNKYNNNETKQDFHKNQFFHFMKETKTIIVPSQCRVVHFPCST